MSDDGQLLQEAAVRFVRVLPGPIEHVWDYLTRSEHLAVWFGAPGQSYSIEPRAGGQVNLMDGHIRGVVTQWQPPRRLTYTWNVFAPHESESRFPETYVTFELQPQGDEVQLTLTHRPIPAEMAPQTIMGWHTFLEMLAALARRETPEARSVLMERNAARYGIG